MKTLKPLLNESQIKIAPLPLWGDYDGVMLYLMHETNFGNAQGGYKFRKIVLSAYHPERLMHDKPGGFYITQREKVVAAASAMAGVRFIPGYYAQKLWYRIVPSKNLRSLETILKQQDQARIVKALSLSTTQIPGTVLEDQSRNDDDDDCQEE